MSYTGLGIATISMKVAPPFPGAVFANGKWVKPPPNQIWVPASGGVRGHWETKKSTSGVKATVKRTLPSDMTPDQILARKEIFKTLGFKKQCESTGMPRELVMDCVEGLQAGVSLQEVLDVLQAQSDAASAAPVHAPVPVAAKPKSRALLYGGLAAGGALVIFLVIRKKR